MPNPFEGKNIVLGVCGGIAAYKAAAFVRLLVTAGATVRVVMTRSAQAFVGPVTFEALSGSPVWTDMFDRSGEGVFRHIEWARRGDGVVILPATANTIAKMAHGMADDPLTTLVLAVKGPVLVCPAMNVRMYENPLVQENMERLRRAGIHLVAACSGALACGDEGPGRLADLETIWDELGHLLSPHDLAGERILITAGPTREPMDPVRFISNPSSGKMGYALARAAWRRGAAVVLVSGPTALPDPFGVTTIRVTTAKEMFDAVMADTGKNTIVVKAAAVSDWRPVAVAGQKVKKADLGIRCAFEKTDDILAALGKKKGRGQILVGFAAETEALEKSAKAKLKAKNLDMVVANQVGGSESGFGAEANQATLFFKDGRQEPLALMDKTALADLILDRVSEIRSGRGAGRKPSGPS